MGDASIFARMEDTPVMPTAPADATSGPESPLSPEVGQSPLGVLAGIASELRAETDPARRFRALCTSALLIFRATQVHLWILDAATRELVAAESLTSSGVGQLPDDLAIEDADHRAARAAREGAPILDSAHALSIPLRGSGNAPAAVLGVNRAATGAAFDESDLAYARILAELSSAALPTATVGPEPTISRAANGSTDALLDTVPLAMITIDLSGQIQRVSSAAERMLTRRRSELLGVDIRTAELGFYETTGERVSTDRLPFTQAMRDQSPLVEREMTLHSGTGQNPVKMSVQALSHTTTGPSGWMIILHDLSEHYAMLQQLTRTETMRTVGQLASAAIHDINNWFGLILGQTEMMLVGEPPAHLVESLESVRQAACDGAEALRRIQDLGRVSTDTDPIPVDINQILRETVDITRPRWGDQLQSMGASVAVLLDLSMPLPMVPAVPSELREVFTNLILNAVDAMPHGGTLRVASRRKRGRVVVSLTDTGTGMADETKERLFEPFFTTKGVRGSGLGLPVSKSMIERHGGRMAVDSELGVGTTFTLSFPVAEHRARSPQIEAAQPPTPSRVLLVEDEPHMRDLMVRMLERDHHKVVVCRSGREALPMLGNEVFDVVLTDLVMPSVDGWDVAQAVRKSQPGVPVILVTGTNQRFNDAELHARGVDLRLNKPFRIDQLRRAISSVLLHTEETPVTDRPRLLAVDDEPAMNKLLTAMLQTSGCDIEAVDGATDALEALADAAHRGQPFSLLFTDMHMPGMDGQELIQRARMLDPRIVTVLLSGDGQDDAIGVADLQLQKPYSLAALLNTLDQALALHRRVAL